MFQSTKQMLYSIVIILVANAVVDAVLPFKSFLGYLGVAIGSSISVLAYNWHVFPHEMRVRCSNILGCRAEVERILGRFFREHTRGDLIVTYKERLPEFLTWNEAMVEMKNVGQELIIVGPGMALFWLRKKLHRVRK